MQPHSDDPRVLFLFPPFGALAFPSIGLSLLKSVLARAGVGCEIRYLNFDFLDALPGELGDRLSAYDEIQRRNEHCVGDWVFASELYDADTARMLDARFTEFVRNRGESDELVERAMAVRAAVPAFLDSVMASIPWERFAVVGFHSLFNQNTASLAIARRLKQLHPHIVTLFGGPNAADEMGVEILRRYPQVDFVVQGEADRTIVPIVTQLLRGEDIREIAGVIHRGSGRSLSGGAQIHANAADMIHDMDALPVPDYDDYFARFRGHGYESGIDVFLPMENARGCWWGQKHHCTFCGLDARTMRFRFKSGERVLDEVKQQVARYGVRSISSVDSILEMSYFNDLLPKLRDSALGLRMFFWVKANLTRAQVHLLADAGVELVQPGLEHLSTDVLAIMRKGTTFLQNVQFLKWAREREMTVFWSLLYGFPGEELRFYETIAAEIPKLVHLYPPKGAVRVRVDRFSPMFTSPEALGFQRLRVAGAYRHVYPFPDETLHKLAYQFDGEYSDRDPALNERIRAVIAGRVEDWNARFFRDDARLDMIAAPGRVLVRDARAADRKRYFLLEGAVAAVYSACASSVTREHLAEVARRGDDGGPLAFLRMTPEDAIVDAMLAAAGDQGDPIERVTAPGDGTVDPILERLRSGGLIVSEGERHLALACEVASVDHWWADERNAGRDWRNMAATRRVSLDL